MKSLVLVVLSLCILLSLVICGPFPVWQRGYDYSRTNANNQETILNTRNVNVNQFGKLFSRQVLGHVYAQPLYIPNLLMPQTNRRHNVVFVATMGNNIYAFDADDANRPEPLWERNFGPTLPTADGMIGAPSLHCTVYTDIYIEVGIVSTPVIDTATNTMYFVNVNKDSHTPYVTNHRLHAIDILTGAERPNSPVIIEATVPGNGDGSQNGILKFNSLSQNQRMSLTMVDDLIIFGFASYCTKPPYHGWSFLYDKNTLERRAYFCTTPDGKEGGMWQSGNPMVYDGKYFYPVTANGLYDGTADWGNSFLKLDFSKNKTTEPHKGMLLPEGILDHFTPFNWEELYNLDLDMSTAGPLLIPGTNVLAACSKQGWCYLVDKNNMGGFSTTTNNNLQFFKPNPNSGTDYPTLTMGVHGGLTTWNSPTKGRLVYMFPIHDTLKAFHFEQNGQVGTFNLAKTEKAADNKDPVNFPGGIVSLSSDASVDGSAIVWVIHSSQGSANRELVPSILRAFDANDITKEIWNSNMNPCRDNSGMLAKFLPAAIYNGKVYTASQSHPPHREAKINVYGILPVDQQNKPWINDPCCYNEGSCGAPDGWCCGGACYDPNIYYCANHTLCPRGVNCGPPDNQCVNCPDSCCNQACYDKSKFTCTLGKLCAIGMASCGTECYDVAKFECEGGMIVPRTHFPSPEPTVEQPDDSSPKPVDSSSSNNVESSERTPSGPQASSSVDIVPRESGDGPSSSASNPTIYLVTIAVLLATMLFVRYNV